MRPRYVDEERGYVGVQGPPRRARLGDYIGGFLEPLSGIVLLTVVFHYPYEVVEDVCNYVVTQDPAVHDAFGCAPDWNDAGILGKVTELDGEPDIVKVNCSFERPMLGYDKVTFEVYGTLKLYDEEE